jgi:hypothetical protein
MFLNKALSVILQQASPGRKVCVVDIESFRSLGAIFNLLKRKKLTEKHEMIIASSQHRLADPDIPERIVDTKYGGRYP